MVRLFVGGLAEDVTPEQLASRFQPFGKVSSPKIMGPKENDPTKSRQCSCRGFGYLDLEPDSEAALRRCLGAVG